MIRRCIRTLWMVSKIIFCDSLANCLHFYLNVPHISLGSAKGSPLIPSNSHVYWLFLAPPAHFFFFEFQRETGRVGTGIGSVWFNSQTVWYHQADNNILPVTGFLPASPLLWLLFCSRGRRLCATHKGGDLIILKGESLAPFIFLVIGLQAPVVQSERKARVWSRCNREL